MADSLLAAAAAVTSQPGFELFDQNIVYTDRHNINPTVSQKFDDDARPDLAQADIDAPVQEPPPPYSQLQSLPQHRPRDGPATLVQPAAEISQIPAQAPPQPEPEQLPRPVQDLESDPRYKCLVTQDQNTGDCCTISFPNVFLRLNKLYAFELQLGFAPSGVVNRLGNLNHSLILQQAFIAGWAMLTVVAFPLLPQFLCCLWVIGQLVFVVFNLVCMCVIIENNCTKVGAQFAVTVIALLLTLLDMLYVCCRTKPQEGEQQPLIGNEQNRRTHSRLAMWLSRYSDLLRLIITEAMVYAFVGTTLTIEGAFGAEELNNCPSSTSGFRAVLLFSTLGGFIFLVYVVHFLVICRKLYICWRMRRKSSTSCQGAFLIVMFLLLFIGERIIQGYGLGIIIVAHNVCAQVDISSLVILFVGTCFIPVLSIVTYFIRSHGEITDFCIVYCTSYLRELEQISERPGTSLATKNAIQALLRRYEFEALQASSEPYFNWRNLFGNFYQRLFSPVVNVLSLLCSVAGVLYLYGVSTFYSCEEHDTFGCTSNTFLFALIAFFCVVNVHILFISVALCIYIVISPIAALLYLVRKCREYQRLGDMY